MLKQIKKIIKLINDLIVLIPTLDIYGPGFIPMRNSIDFDEEDEAIAWRNNRLFNATRSYVSIKSAHEFIQDKIENLVQEFGKV